MQQTKQITCTKCGGSGQVLVNNYVTKTNQYSYHETCDKCNGSGTITINAETV